MPDSVNITAGRSDDLVSGGIRGDCVLERTTVRLKPVRQSGVSGGRCSVWMLMVIRRGEAETTGKIANFFLTGLPGNNAGLTYERGYDGTGFGAGYPRCWSCRICGRRGKAGALSQPA